MNRILVELEINRCQRTYGTSPCTASGSAPLKCYNSFQTCQDLSAYTHTIGQGTIGRITLSFTDTAAELPQFRCFPYLESYSSSPPEVQPTGLALQDKATVKIADFAYDDTYVDPYLSDRTHGPATSGTFWPRFIRRHENQLVGAKARIYVGDIKTTTDLTTTLVAEYIVESWSIDDDGVTLKLADPLSLLNPDKSKAVPRPQAKLTTDYPTGVTGVIYSTPDATYEEPANYSGRHVRINDEIIFYASETNGQLVGIDRAKWGTEQKAHAVGDVVQECRGYQNAAIKDVLLDLIQLYVPASYLDTTQIDAQFTSFYENIKLNFILSDYEESVQDVINDICRLFAIQIFWNRTTSKVNFRTLLPSNLVAQTTISDDDIESITSPTKTSKFRATQIAVYTEPKNATVKPKEVSNYANVIGISDEIAGGEFVYKQHTPKIIYSRYTAADASSYISSMVARLHSSFKEDLWQIDVVVAVNRVSTLAIGDYVFLNTNVITDEYGANRPILMLVQSIRPDFDAGRVRMKLLESKINNQNYAVIGSMQLGDTGNTSTTAVMF